jgi:uncharacterized protein YndB with AHSA1/START domain
VVFLKLVSQAVLNPAIYESSLSVVVTSLSVAGSPHGNALSSQNKPGPGFWSGACSVACMMGPDTTATRELSNRTLATRKRTVERHGSEPLTVHLELDIRADARRLFHALTAPEYLETWVSFPGHPPGCSTLATRINHDYMIAHLCDNIRKTVITGRYLVCERRNVMMSWRVEGTQTVTESYVDVRLLGNFEYTTLILRHRDLNSWQHYLWHRCLWSLSLERLRRLYDSLPHEDNSSRSRIL